MAVQRFCNAPMPVPPRALRCRKAADLLGFPALIVGRGLFLSLPVPSYSGASSGATRSHGAPPCWLGDQRRHALALMDDGGLSFALLHSDDLWISLAKPNQRKGSNMTASPEGKPMHTVQYLDYAGRQVDYAVVDAPSEAAKASAKSQFEGRAKPRNNAVRYVIRDNTGKEVFRGPELSV